MNSCQAITVEETHFRENETFQFGACHFVSKR